MVSPTIHAPIPSILTDWRESPRVRAMNDQPVASNARYVLCWLQQALRAHDNPVIDAAVRLGNALGLPVLVYHGVREDYPYASDRLHDFILGASRDLGQDCRARGIACVQHVDRDGHRERGLVYRLAAEAAALVVEDQPTFVARWQVERVAARTVVPVLAVNAACLVPPAVLGEGIGGRSGFLRRHEPARGDWSAAADEVPEVPAFDGELPFVPDRLEEIDLVALVAALAIDHSLPVSAAFPAGRVAAQARLGRLVAEVLPGYATNRNDATRKDGASGLSPYLHFGVLGPREVMRAVEASGAGARHRTKLADELLGWREWFHYQARALAAHAGDTRPDLESLTAMLRGETRDETWNACQRQFLRHGWMHNNLRMYWAKRIIAMTPDPDTAWSTACYLNDRLSLDGRDPATYGNIAATFGGAPADRERAIYGRVVPRGDGSTRGRDGGEAWIARAATRPVPAVSVPDRVPTEPYLAAG